MKITKLQLRRLINEAMYSPYGAKSAAIRDAGISDENLEKLAILSQEDPEYAAKLSDDATEYAPDSPLSTGDSFQDIKRFDKDMQDTMLIHKKLQMADEFESYMAAEGTAIMSALYKVANTPDVHLYVTSRDEKNWQAPGSEVVRNPEAFHLMAIATDDSAFSDAVEKVMPFDLDGDDQDAILLLLEKMAGDNNIGHIPEGYQYSPEATFLAWFTENNPNLKIYVDP